MVVEKKQSYNTEERDMGQGEISNEAKNKKVWIKLTGPKAESLGEAFLGPTVVVLQEIKRAEKGKEKGTDRAEDVAKSVQEEKEHIIDRIIKGGQIPPGPGADGDEAQVAEEGRATARVSPASGAPIRTIITGTAGAGKTIKVLKNYRIILLGKPGAGKSSLANTIFGEEVFKINGTSECRAESRSVHGKRITLMDTPGFFDTNRTQDEMKFEIERCVKECSPGPHAFLIVLNVETFAEQDRALVEKMSQCFSEEALKHTVVVFTHVDKLPEGTKIVEFVDQNKCLCDLVRMSSGRCQVDNKSSLQSNKSQVTELLSKIDEMVMKNKGCYYSNKMSQQELKEEGDKTSTENIPQGDHDSVSKNVWLKLTGPAAQSLAEVFFSPAISVVQDIRGASEEDEKDENKEEEDDDKGEEEEEGANSTDAAEEEKEEEEEGADEGRTQEEKKRRKEKEKKVKSPEKERENSSGSGWGIWGLLAGMLGAALTASLWGGLTVFGFGLTGVVGVGTVVAAIMSSIVGGLVTLGGLGAGAAIVWAKFRKIKEKIETFLAEQGRSILLVFVVFLLLLLSFFTRVPMAVTMLLWFGIIALFLVAAVLLFLL